MEMRYFSKRLSAVDQRLLYLSIDFSFIDMFLLFELFHSIYLLSLMSNDKGCNTLPLLQSDIQDLSFKIQYNYFSERVLQERLTSIFKNIYII